MYMHMKYLMLIGLLLCVGASTVSAQPKQEARADKIKAYRVAVFTEILNLSSEEAQDFWPIYNEYLDKRESLQKELKMTRQIDGMNDKEVEDYIKKYFELRNKELDLEKDLTQKLRKVLPLRKIAKIPVAEREFREALVQKLQEAREKRMERRGIGNK
jgi:ribonucleotide reductase beta subunit family protein with ferritin-like domain